MNTLNMNWNFEGVDANTAWTAIIFLIVGYLFGSFLFSRFYISVFKKGDDTYVDSNGVRKRMPRFGASWTWRVHGPAIGLTHFLTDFAKPIIGYYVFVFPLQMFVPQFSTALPIVYFLGIIIGNNWPIWWKFEGGVGIAAAVGSVMVVNWVIALAGIAGWALFLKLTKQTGLSALLGGFVALTLAFIPEVALNPIAVYPHFQGALNETATNLTAGFPMALTILTMISVMVIKRSNSLSQYGRLFKKLVTLDFKKAEMQKQDRFHSVDDE